MTIGTIYNLDENNPASFSDVTNPALTTIQGPGSYVIGSDNVTITGILDFIMRPTLWHSFDNFTMSGKFEVGSNYDFEFGLLGRQRFNSIARMVNIKRISNTTQIEIHYFPGSNVILNKILPVVFTGSLEVKVTYSNLTWKIALINNGKVFTIYHKYKREIGGGNVTSKFMITNIGDPLVINKMKITVNCPKNATVFIGDSITFGTLIPFGQGGTFAEQYASEFGNTTIFASGSAGSVDVVNSLDSLALLEPSKIFTLIGDNDLYSDIPFYADKIQTINNTLTALPSAPEVYFLNLTPELTDEGYYAFKQYLDSQAGTLNIINVWEELARTDNQALVQPQYVVDHVHLTQLAHNELFELIQGY